MVLEQRSGMGQKGMGTKGNGREHMGGKKAGSWPVAGIQFPAWPVKDFPPASVALGEPRWSQSQSRAVTVGHRPCGAEWGTPWIPSKVPEPG